MAAKRKKVLLLIETMSHYGGTQKVVDLLASTLAKEGYDVIGANFDAPGAPNVSRGTTVYHQLGPLPRLPLVFRWVRYAIAARRLRSLKKQLNPDVTLSNLWGADLINILAGARGKRIALCHINVVGNPVNRLMVRLRVITARVYRRFDRVIAVNPILARELMQLYSLLPGQVGCIENFVEGHATSSKLPNDNCFRFVWCGRFVSEKNVEGLLHIWNAFRPAEFVRQLVLIGDGPLKDQCIQLAGTLDLALTTDLQNTRADVVFLGKIDDPQAYMQGAVALLSTSWAEGMPMVILEALSVGTPVLASDGPSGGERAALIGYGEPDPKRAEPELTEAGALLPIPSPDRPATLTIWADLLRDTCAHSSMRSQWHYGAKERSKEFTPKEALKKWRQVLEEVA